METYYTPEISEFHVGFEYEMKENFQDGTVKTQEQFDQAKWGKRTSNSALMYVERSLTGRNAKGVGCGIRVKHLDKEDIEDLEWQSFENRFYFRVPDVEESDGEYFRHGFLYPFPDYEMYFSEEDRHFIILDFNRDIIFQGTLKNKSELRKLMVQLGIV